MGESADRKEPRFNTATDVVMSVEGASEMQELWTANISKGGLFVVTRTPPPMGTHVRVSLETPHGSLTLQAEVVHVVPPEVADHTWQPAGVGLAFLHVTDEQRQRIQRYVEGIATALREQDTGAASATAQAAVAGVMEDVRALLGGLDSGDVYAALGRPRSASVDELKARCDELGRTLASPPAGASPAQALRIQNAARALEKVRARVAALAETAAQQTAQQQAAQAEIEKVKARQNQAKEAKAHADTARAHLDRQNFAMAESEYEQAAQKDPAVVAYQLGHAWSIAVNPKRPQAERLKKALTLLKPISEKYKIAEVPYTIGMVYHLMERHQDAEKAMQEALALDKTHHGALRMVRLMEARRAKESHNAGGGLLGKLKMR